MPRSGIMPGVALPFVPFAFADALLDALSTAHGLPAYAAMAFALGIGCLGVPIPEEAVLATAGCAAAAGGLSLAATWVVAVVVVLGLDCVLFAVGRRTGPAIERSRIGRRIRPSALAAAHRFFETRGVWAVVGARFVMGTRIPTMFLAGALGVPRRRFLLAAGGAGLVSAAIPIALGYVFADRLRELVGWMATVRGFVLAGVVLGALVLAFVLWRLLRAAPGAADTTEERA